MRGSCSDFGVYSSTYPGLGDPCYQVILPEGVWGFTAHQIMMRWKCLLRVPSQRVKLGEAKAQSQGCQRCLKEINSPFRVPQSWFPCVSCIVFITPMC